MRQDTNDFRILLLDAYSAHKGENVKALCKERGFMRIMYGGGVTGILQWNDTDLHARIELEILELEAQDFHKQLEQRPWRVPTRERQDLVDDVAACWANLPHANIGVMASKRTGLCIALPARNADGSVSEVAAEDAMVTREAGEFFVQNGIPKLRAKALQVIYDAVETGNICEFWDIEKYLDGFDDGDDGELVEGQEVDPLQAELAADGDDDGDDDDDDDADDGDDEPGGPDDGNGQQLSISAPAEQQLAVLCASGDDAAFAERVATTMGSYDAAIAMASDKMGDTLAANYLRMRKTEAWKMLRRTDIATEAALSEFLMKDREKISEVRDKCRQEDDERRRRAKKEKEAVAFKKDELERKRADVKRLEQLAELAMQIPHAWSVNDFGQGCELKNLPPKAVANLRDVLARLRMNSCELPEDLAAQWVFFLDTAPDLFFRLWGPAIGANFVVAVKGVLQDLKEDKQAFVRWVRDLLKRRKGDFVI
jgi:hypothetical protein